MPFGEEIKQILIHSQTVFLNQLPELLFREKFCIQSAMFSNRIVSSVQNRNVHKALDTTFQIELCD